MVEKHVFGRAVQFAIALLFLFGSVGYAQPGVQQTRLQDEIRLFQKRADDLADGVLKDSAGITAAQKSLYLAYLARITWKQNTFEARKYLGKSVEIGLDDLLSAEKETFSAKLQTAKKTLNIVLGLDKNLGDAFSRQVSKIVNAKTSGDKTSSDWLVAVGLDAAEREPRLAYDLGAQSLKFGLSQNLPKLISRLYALDSALADKLFLLSLTMVRRSYDGGFVETLGYQVFPVSKGSGFSDLARRSYLGLLSDTLATAAATEADRPNCSVVKIIAPLLLRFDEYMPEQTPIVRQNFTACIPFVAQDLAESVKPQSEGTELQTADDFFKAARNTADRRLKGRYFSKGIAKLSGSKKFDEIISILDHMTEEERKSVEFGWDFWRVENAAKSAHSSIKDSDMPAVYRIFAKTPLRLRPYVRLRVVSEVPSKESLGFIIENLHEIQKEITSIEIATKDATEVFISLLPLIVKTQGFEAETTFREMVKYINKTDADNPDAAAEKDYAPFSDYIALPVELLEIDEHGIYGSIANVSSRKSRIRLKLGLLESCLKKLSELKTKKASEGKSSSS